MRFAATASFIGVAILMAGVMIQAAPVGIQASIPDFIEQDFDVDHHKPGHHDKPGEGGKTGNGRRNFPFDHHKPGHYDKPVTEEPGHSIRDSPLDAIDLDHHHHKHDKGKPGHHVRDVWGIEYQHEDDEVHRRDPGKHGHKPPKQQQQPVQGSPPKQHGHQEGHKLLDFEERDLPGKIRGLFGGKGHHHGRRSTESDFEERDNKGAAGKIKGAYGKLHPHGPRSAEPDLDQRDGNIIYRKPKGSGWNGPGHQFTETAEFPSEHRKRSDSTERLEYRFQPEKPPVTKTPVPPKAKDPPPPPLKRSVDQRRWVARDEQGPPQVPQPKPTDPLPPPPQLPTVPGPPKLPINPPPPPPKRSESEEFDTDKKPVKQHKQHRPPKHKPPGKRIDDDEYDNDKKPKQTDKRPKRKRPGPKHKPPQPFEIRSDFGSADQKDPRSPRKTKIEAPRQKGKKHEPPPKL